MRKPAKLLTLMAIFLAALLVSYFVFRAKPVDLIVEMNLLDTKNAQRGELFVAGSFSQTVEICGAGPYEDGLREHETALWAKDKFGLKIWQLKIDRFQYENPFFFAGDCMELPKGEIFEIRVWEVFNGKEHSSFSVAVDTPSNWDFWFPTARKSVF